MELRRIGVLSLAKISAAIYALLGLVGGAIVSLVSLVVGTVAPAESGGALSALFGVAAVVVLPVFYGVVGFVGSLIMAALYNWLAGMVGGVHIDLRVVAPHVSAATTQHSGQVSG